MADVLLKIGSGMPSRRYLRCLLRDYSRMVEKHVGCTVEDDSLVEFLHGLSSSSSSSSSGNGGAWEVPEPSHLQRESYLIGRGLLVIR